MCERNAEGFHFGQASYCAKPNKTYQFDNYRYCDNNASIYEEILRWTPSLGPSERLS
jgi:hypothetical protein